MEELNEEIRKCFHLAESFEISWTTKIEESLLKFDRFLKNTTFRAESNNVTCPSVKRPKHTFIGCIETKSGELKASTEEQFSIGGEMCTQPQQSSQRPQRAAKTKVINCLKEIPLSAKLGRPSNPKVGKQILLNVKQEKNVNSSLFALKSEDVSIFNLPEGIKRNSDEEDRMSDARSKEKNNKSLEIVQPKDIVIVLSDDEINKMPPPVTVPKTRSQRTKKKIAKILNFPLDKMTIVKTEKENVTDEPSLAKNEIKGEKIFIKKEKISECTSTTQTVSLTSTNRGKAKKITVKPIVMIKKEDEIENGVVEEETSAKVCENISNGEYHESVESVYEDAINGTNKEIPQVLQFDKEAVVKVARLKSQYNNLVINNDSSDATFVSSSDCPIPVKPNEINATFVFENKQEKGGSTAAKVAVAVDLDSKTVDATFNIEEPVENISKRIGMNLMGDESVEKFHEEKEKYVPHAEYTKVQENKTLKKNQIFNPFVPSPMKTKIEAYEKHTGNIKIASPYRSRAKERKKENEVPVKRFVTPTTTGTVSKFLTPTQQSNITPFNGVKKLPCSSKQVNLEKKSSKSINTRSGASRDNSADDTRRGGINQALIEKKKNRDLKQQQAAKNREELDKQKLQRAHKVIQEKEAKIKAIEAVKKAKQQKPLLEKQQQKLQSSTEKLCHEQPRTVSKSQVNGNILDDETNVGNKVHKQHQINKQQKMQTPQKVFSKTKLYYDFEMLNTDDSTDDESKPSTKKPLIPVWSRLYDRKSGIEKQSSLAKYIVDSFFSVQPMTPNLREIFPAIDPRCLKRNSSAYWKTPPRYSEIPKY